MKRRGFTLIELLVVIAIIAILAAILFPVFAQAREKARQITCVSNMKQIALGVLMYQQDYDEYYPMGHYITWNDPAPNDIEYRWADLIEPYIKSGDGSIADAGSTQINYYGVGGVWSCPDSPVVQNANYGANWELFGDGEIWSGEPVGTPIQNDSIVQTPDQSVMICEKGMDQGDSSWPNFQPWEGMWVPYPSNTTPAYPGAAGTTYTYPDHLDIGGQARFDSYGTGPTGDCDMAGASSTTPSTFAQAYNNCDMMPRYRHAGDTQSNFAFCDGHVKSEARGNINWYSNIYIQGAYEALSATQGWGGAY